MQIASSKKFKNKKIALLTEESSIFESDKDDY